MKNYKKYKVKDSHPYLKSGTVVEIIERIDDVSSINCHGSLGCSMGDFVSLDRLETVDEIVEIVKEFSNSIMDKLKKI